MADVTLAFVQTAPTFGDVAANLAEVGALLTGVEADLIVLPELFATGYSFLDRAEATSLAEPFGAGPTTDHLCAWSRATGAVIVAGYPERDGERIYNAAAVVAGGEPQVSYRKAHLFGFERDCFDPGDGPFPVVEHGGMRVGVMICFDWMFPEASRCLALGGADVIAHPSNLVLPGWCQRAMEIRALENRVFTVTANRHGEEHREPRPALRFTGASQIVGPRGTVLTTAEPEGTTVRSHVVDLAEARSKHIPSGNDVLADRRPDLYQSLTIRSNRSDA